MSVVETQALPPALVEQFDREGVVVLRGVFADWIEPLREGVAALMADPSPLERTYHPADGSAPFFQDLCNWQRIPAFREFVFGSPAAALAAQLMRSRVARFFHDHVLVKEPGTSVVTPWHHDKPYYCVGGEQSVSLWIPLDPVAQEISLECVAGSHRWNVLHRPKRFDGTDLYQNDDATEMPDIEGQRDQYTIRRWAMAPGDAVAFDFRTVHGAAANLAGGHRRRVFSARWVGDDAVFIDRHGKGSPPLSHLTLKDGEPLDGPDFPVVLDRARA
ncbi:phytanoyl-CoA dioxygenase [Pandoraea terrae]|uniref:Phytanoyl-CoA dioxygenase n=1 Tax=Pandoraea terrae TaxID=1537710 RepID=A0A5E4TJ73_9BURK|nr:phytanoyl-CoA dioxygenase family protein [Pandoraea terrae]VVD87915.1 phytanoyl-CoA dioxygenase [Pandoraea terrae]